MTDCLFCGIAAGTVPAHVVASDELTVAFLDVRPVFKGHVLVIPRAHYETLASLPGNLIAPLFGMVQRISAAMPAGLGAQGSFVGLNNTVSQSVPHLHVHVVPRTKGDGLRGFFWPRGRYADDDEAAGYARRLAAAVAAGSGGTSGPGQAGPRLPSGNPPPRLRGPDSPLLSAANRR